MNSRETSARDVHRTITDKIVESIKAGAGTFQMPWHRTAKVIRPLNAYTRAPYRGINVIALWTQGLAKGYLSDHCASYRQWQMLGAQVNKGERGTVIVFYKQIEPKDAKDKDPDNRDDARPRLFARASRVFNADQVSGWSPPRFEPKSVIQILAGAEAFIHGTEAVVRQGGDRAYYDRKHDLVVMPPRELFKSTRTSSARDSYYAVFLHELTHWSGAPHRLDRTFGERFGDDAYAMEELVAELGSAFLCADLGISNDPRPDHAAYVASWLRVLKRDHKAVFTAASRASAAAEYLTGLSAVETA